MRPTGGAPVQAESDEIRMLEVERLGHHPPSRAVTEADYAEVAQRHPEVQKAVATRRWTGSWYTIFVAIDRAGGRAVDADFEEEMIAHLERYRMAGVDVEIKLA